MKRSHETSLVTPKDHLNIGCWNIRTMYTIGKTATVMKEMRRYKLNILGLSETFLRDAPERDRCYTTSPHLLILLGDANSKVGSDNTGWEGTLGNEGLGIMNDNGLRFASLCTENSLVIGGTCFRHKEIHKYTWTSPNGRDRNQIDHIAIRRRFRRSLLDVKVQRGADAASDHHLVRCKVRLKLARNRKKQMSRTIYDTEKLKDPIQKRNFTIALKNRFEALASEDLSVDDAWTEYRDIYRSTAAETLGQRARTRKDWKKDKEVKKRARADKRRTLERIAEEAERAAHQNNLKELYMKAKLLSGCLKKPSTGIRAKDGTVITTEEEVLERWKKLFYEVLNVACEETVFPEGCQLDICEEPIEMDTSPFTIEEVRRVISRLKNGKAPGVDNISVEMLKASPAIALYQLLNICNQTLDQCKAPSDWKKSLLAKVPKIGDPSICDNYRGISLLLVPYKVFCRLLLSRMQEGVEKRLRQEQAAYRRDKGTTEQIFILRNILEQSAEWQAPLYIGFIDFKKAFDSVRRDRLWNILKHYGIPENFVNIIRDLYEGSTCCVVERGQSQTKVLQTNTKVANPISINGQDVEEVSSFIYLGAIVQGEGGSDEEIKRRLSIARRAYATLNPVWRSKMYSKHTKLKILKSCVTSVLLYGAEMRRITSTDIEQLDVFHRTCLRRNLGIFWPHTISNCDLYERTKERPISETVKVRRWRWIGHILRREKDNNSRVALTWNPEG
ncbi:hypothetical protein ACROYT_G010881 [Oculina patagonica]